MHAAVSHSGRSRARLRFSKRAVLVAKVPSNGMALTGSSSPRPARISASTCGVARSRVSSAAPSTEVTGSSCRFPTSDEDETLFEAIKAGAQGYLLKNLEAEEFFSLLDRASRGEPALTPALARKLLLEFAKPAAAAAPGALTDREREVLDLMVEGVTSNRKLAKNLGLSENTVKFHVRNILDKLRLHNRAQAVGYAMRQKKPDREGTGTP